MFMHKFYELVITCNIEYIQQLMLNIEERKMEIITIQFCINDIILGTTLQIYGM